jgi:pimeloyl-[acyl-carrier protein] methyl ester esterase
MSLHVETLGSGAPLLLIHGWGMHGGMWGGVAERLAQDFRVLAVDLPGHGKSTLPSPAGGRGVGGEGLQAAGEPLTLTLSRQRERGLSQRVFLDSFVNQLSAQFTEPLTVCGWSLGGQIALHWALREPEQVRRLILVASTPCFVRRPDWECAMAAETLAQFATALQQDHAQTLRRFLALQVRGSDNERELLAGLREALFSRGEPDMTALQSGLEILRDCDLRESLHEVAQPTLVIAGERDTLTPPQASQYMATQMPDARLAMIAGAAHAPFLSHPEMVTDAVNSFLKKKND